MYEYRTLESTPVETLHQAFLSAFSDYQVQLAMPLATFEYTLQRRGYVPEISCGAFAEGQLVGFTLNGLRLWEGKLTAYDIMTGVSPAYRKQGISSQVFSYVKELLKQKSTSQYLLEVLRENTAAFELYQKQGFKVNREFSCYRLDKAKYRGALPAHNVGLTEAFAPIEALWDFYPSWQNSSDSVNAAAQAFAYAVVRDGDRVIGYGIVDKITGDIPQLAVDKQYRSKGVGSSIVHALLNATEADKLSILNIDDTYPGMAPFLTGLGFEYYVGQYEMVLEEGLLCK